MKSSIIQLLSKSLAVLACVSISAFIAEAQNIERIRAELEFQSQTSFMGSVTIEENGQTLLNEAYGLANIEWNIPNSTTTKYRIASITKQFTAAAILLLAERDLLSADQLIGEYLREIPAEWESISIHHLLTNSSGIPDNFSYESQLDKFKPLSLPEDFESAMNQPLLFEPGTAFAYSNTGYWILGYIIESVSAKSYGEFISSNIFNVLGMNDSGYEENLAVISGMAAGYSEEGGVFTTASYIDMSRPFAAGSLYSTTEDLMKWSTALLSGEILTAESLSKLITPYLGEYAMGLYSQTSNGRQKIWHNGGIDGFNTYISFSLARDIKITILSNVENSNVTELASAIEYVLFDEPVLLDHESEPIDLPTSTLQKFTGSYSFEQEGGLEISIEDEYMYLEFDGAPNSRQLLTPVSETVYSSMFPFIHYEFFYDEVGKSDRVALYQRGSTFEFTKVAD